MTPAPILVQKFGGTSVSTSERRGLAVAHVRRAIADGYQVAIVVSAMGRRGDPYATDTLLDLLRANGGPVAPEDYDLMFTCGETISAALMSHTLKRAGIPAIGLTAAQARIFTDGRHLEGQIEEVETSRMRRLMQDGVVPVITGGQGVARETLDFTTLGRGGSDTSGVAVGAALRASRVDIFTDVEGVAVVDPRLVPGARLLSRISYEAMHELARFGAKVVHPRAIVAGRDGRLPVVVRSTFSQAAGTVIGDVEDESEVVGLALLPPMDTVVLPPGSVTDAVRESWEDQRLVMSVADTRSGDLFVGAADDKREAMLLSVRETGAEPIRGEGRCCWLSVIGSPTALRQGHVRWLTRLAEAQVRVRGFGIADRRITCLVADEDRTKSAQVLYEAAGL